jgi:hypothetical protein
MRIVAHLLVWGKKKPAANSGLLNVTPEFDQILMQTV